jgi:hypothetical protein
MIYSIDAAGFELPSTFELGLAYRANVVEDNTLTIASSYEDNNFADDSHKFGVEYGFRDLLFLRGGMIISLPDPRTGRTYSGRRLERVCT